MNNGWSEYHRKKAMEQIDKLSRKLDDVKHDLALARSEKTFRRIVDKLPQRPQPDERVVLPETEQQIGGS